MLYVQYRRIPLCTSCRSIMLPIHTNPTIVCTARAPGTRCRHSQISRTCASHYGQRQHELMRAFAYRDRARTLSPTC
jgi:hypothetical protein